YESDRRNSSRTAKQSHISRFMSIVAGEIYELFPTLAIYKDPPYSSGVVRSFECLGGGWQLIKDQY
ncbi:MAG TPA: hypothetical protein VF955_08555, partial [Pyrinomonadaceae bacterium]